MINISLATPNKAILSDRINKLIKSLSDGIYEREATMKLCLLAALAGESVFLIGPPGIAKSLIAKRLIEAFEQPSFFDYLMTRFSTPEEVFGPLSIQELKDNGRYLRLIDGYLPTAQVVFLDEIWKAGPAILNTLLTVVNERTFKNGQDILSVPMRLLITASNELPEQDSGLDALYDRLLVRILMNRIQDKQNFKSMLESKSLGEIDPTLKISDEEYNSWKEHIGDIKLGQNEFDKIYTIKTWVENYMDHVEVEQCDSDLYISDRRWKKAIRLLQASAFFNGRDEINSLDLLLLQHCLWHSPSARNVIVEVIQKFAIEQAFNQTEVLSEAKRAKDIVDEMNRDIIEQLSVNFTQEKLIRKERFNFNFSMAQRYTVNNNTRMIKLVLLQPNPSVSEQESGDSRWVYVDGDTLEKKIRTGKCELYGFVNKNLHLCRLHFEIDAKQRLIIKDIANRNVIVSISTDHDVTKEQHQKWQNTAKDVINMINEAEYRIKKARIEFHSALPHNFISDTFPIMIENSINQATETISEMKRQIVKSTSRIADLVDYFSY